MHTMREQFMVGMRAVFIYHYDVSFFVKGRCQVTYGSFAVITYFFIKPIGKKSSDQNIQSQFSLSYDGRL